MEFIPGQFGMKENVEWNNSSLIILYQMLHI